MWILGGTGALLVYSAYKGKSPIALLESVLTTTAVPGAK